MENQTAVTYFYILPFSDYIKIKTFIFSLCLLIYVVGILVNSSIITVISLDPHLHHPMYLFICNLSFVDMLYPTVTVPKFLHILLSGNNIVSLAECFTQFYFYCASGSAEEILLFIMGYDRYVAICLPLYYHRILCKRNCVVITMGLWTTAWLNSLLFVVSVLYMSTCHSNIIHQFFCDVKSMTRTTCTSSGPLYIIILLEILLLGVVPVSCSFLSYINIFSTILSIKTTEGRRKAFSTCLSHLSVITLYYSSSALPLLLPSYSDVMEFVLSAFYTMVVPLLNPMIYSLQNSGVNKAVNKIMGARHINFYNS